MDTSPAPIDLFPDSVRDRLNAIVAESGCAALLDGMRGQPQPEPIKRGIDYLGEHEHWRRIRVKLEQMDPQAFQDLGAVLADHPSVLASLSQLSMPTTVIVGKADKPFIEPSRRMQETLPNASLAVIDAAGHSPQYENPEAWREAVDTHLREAEH